MSRTPYLRVAFESARPSQLVLIVGVYLLGVTIASRYGAPVETGVFVAGLLPLLFVSMSIHYTNEYADYETDALTDRTPFSGGSGALVETGVDRSFVATCAVVSGTIGVVSAIVLLAIGTLSWEAAVILGVATIAGWQYSVGPLRLAWRGMGEVTNAVLGGLALPMYGAAVVGGPVTIVAIASLPFALLVLLNLFATQWPDRAADGQVGKRTLAVRLLPRTLRRVYLSTALLAAFTLVVLSLTILPLVVLVAAIPAVPLVVWGAAGFTERHVPLPTVSAMVVFAMSYFGVWATLV